jgi:hypothetical protein
LEFCRSFLSAHFIHTWNLSDACYFHLRLQRKVKQYSSSVDVEKSNYYILCVTWCWCRQTDRQTDTSTLRSVHYEGNAYRVQIPES